MCQAISKGSWAARAIGFWFPSHPQDTLLLVMDNLNIHRHKSPPDLLGEEFGSEVRSRFTAHYTPKHGSWLNQAEIEIGRVSRQSPG
jgi:hypothetical protein